MPRPSLFPPMLNEFYACVSREALGLRLSNDGNAGIVSNDGVAGSADIIGNAGIVSIMTVL